MPNRAARRRGKKPQRFATGGIIPKGSIPPTLPGDYTLPRPEVIKAAQALYKKAPRKVRFLRWLGFAERHAARPNTDEFKDYAEGWQIIASIWFLDWKDRLRVLISGRVMCHSAIKTFPAVERFTNTAAFSVLPPGYQPGMPGRTITREELKRAAMEKREQLP